MAQNPWGYGPPPQGGQYPAQQGGQYPAQQGGQYPAQQGGQYPAQQGGQYPAQQGGQYPAQQGGQYPAQQQPGQYPGQQQPGQYPGQQQPGQYPAQGLPPGHGAWHGQSPHGGPQLGHAAPSRFDSRFKTGLALTVLGCLIGAVLLLKMFVLDVPPSYRDVAYAAMKKASIAAYVPVAVYLFVPYMIDRFDPEPAWALFGVFAWGALFATGISAVINTAGAQLVGEAMQSAEAGQLYGAAISAPLFEELTKGMAIFGMVVFLRREFDGVVDGIIYATFVAIGFAATENIIYYFRAEISTVLGKPGGQNLGDLFFLRGVLTPWLHPMFTSMTGIGFGLAREANEGWKKVVYPLGGYFIGVFMHAWWNGMARVFGGGAVILNLVVGLLMAAAFFIIICVLVHKKGLTIRKFLEDELYLGNLTQEEIDLISSYGGRLKARMSWRGKLGAEFVAAGARLALSKFHTARAMKGQKRTISADFIVPLRQDLARLRQQMMAQHRG